MKLVNLNVQEPWLHRVGFRGRWITVYLHKYNGTECSERLHAHPWALAIGVVLSGNLVEVVGNTHSASHRRGFLSIRVYTRKVLHRIVEGHARTVFVGFVRTQKRISGTAEICTRQGYCHYTEIMPGEPGYGHELVSSRSG